MPVGNDYIQLPTLQIPVELDMDAGRQALKELERETKRSGDKAAESLTEASGETKRWTDRLKDAAAAVGGLALMAGNRLVSGLRGAGRVIGSATSALIDFTALGIMGVSRGLRRLDAELEDNGRAWKAVGDAAGVAASGLDAAARTIMTVSNLLLGMKVAAAVGAAALAVMANRAAAEFTPSFNRVRTLLPEVQAVIHSLRAEVNQLAGDMGVAGSTANDALYEIFSAMPELAKEPARAMDLLRVALETHTTGFSDAGTAAAAYTAIMNAFKIEAERAEEVSDRLFATQDRGVTTMGELAASIGKVGPLVASLGGEYEDVLAIVAAITPTGVETTQVMTQIRAALSNLLKPSAEAQKAAKELKVEFSATAVESKGLLNFLLDIIEATDGRPDQLARFFGSTEALALLTSLSGETENVRDALNDISSASGSHRQKVQTMNDSWQRQKEILKEGVRAELRLLGFELESVGVTGLEALNALVGAVLELDTAVARVGGASGAGARLADWVKGLFPKEAAAELRDAREELEFLMFGEAALSQNQSIGGVRSMKPIARPAEPTSVAYSRHKIDETEALRNAKAVAELARSGDMEAYQQSIRETQEAVNKLVLTEMDRLRSAGVSEKEIAKLASSYRVLREQTDQAAVARKRLQEEFSDRLFRLTADAQDIQARQLDNLEARFREVYGDELPSAVREGMEKLRANVESSRLLETFRDQFQELLRMPATLETSDQMMEAYHALREEAEQLPENSQLRQQYLDLLHRIADAVGRIRDERRKESEEDKKATREAERARRERLAALRDTARTIEENARAAISLANAVGLVDDEATKAMESMATFASSLARVLGGDITALPAVIASAGSIIAQIAGGDPADEERRQAMRRNTEAMERLRLGLQELGAVLSGGTTGSTLAGIESALAKFRDVAVRDDLTVNQYGEARAEAWQALQALGVTMDDLHELAAGFGLELNTDADLFKLLEALQQFQFDQLFTGYAGQLEMLRMEFDLFDIEDPIEQLQRVLEVFEEFTGLDVPEFDLATAEGRQAAEAWIQDMYRRLQAGELTPEDLGGMSLDQFLQFLADYERRLDEAEGGGVVGATDSTRMSVNITQAQASQLISLDVTRNRYLEQMVGLLGGSPAMAAVAAPTPAAVGVGGAAINTYVTLEEGAVQIPISTTGGVSREDGRRAGAAAGAAAGDALARRLGQMHRARGGRGAPKVVQEEARR